MNLQNCFDIRFPKRALCVAVSAVIASAGQAANPIAFPATPISVTSPYSPNVVLALSVEFPTMGSAYNGARLTTGLQTSPADGTGNIDPYFDPTNAYIGYWRSDRCYSYDTTNNWFFEAAVATSGMACSGSGTTGRWSGNFLNWAQTSAIDIFRLTLSGGYRYRDTSSLTVLERAKLDSQVLGFTNSLPTKEVGSRYNLLNSNAYSVNPALYTPFSAGGALRVTYAGTTFFASTWDVAVSGTTATYSNKLDFGPFFPRVKVCDASLGATASNCTSYVSGSTTSLKPTGEIQNRSDSMRFSAFGYLLDNTNDRDGGIMRASMRTVAPKVAVSGALQANTLREWNDDGTFVLNPDGASEGNSGVANYLNKFGLGLLTTSYKGYDPVGELYSESLRYLAGRQPQPESTQNVTEAMKDGFPVYTSWSDPIQGVCQSNFILTIGDTNTWCDGRVPGGSELNTGTCGSKSYAAESLSGGGTINASTWTDKIGALEGTNGPGAALSTISTGAGASATYLMAGLAYWANTTNIRPDLGNNANVKVQTYVVDVGETSGTPYYQRQYWYAAKYGGFTDTNGDGKPSTGEWEIASTLPSNTFPTGFQPQTYFLASDGKALQTSLQAAFQSFSNKGNGAPILSTSATRFTSTSDAIFTTTMNPSGWTGDLVRYPAALVNGVGQVTGAATWSASTILTGTGTTAANPVPTSRRLFTYDTSSGAAVSLAGTVSSVWSSLPAAIMTRLEQPLTGQSGLQSAAEGQRRLGWLQGTRTAESGSNALRGRTSLLGDAGNASALYIGPAGKDGYPDADYVTFASTTRPGTVYIGTSDGMLHGFDAATGVERMGYVPGRLFNRFAQTPNPSFSRVPMVDATPLAADVKIGSNWKTALIGGMGSGAKGVYALDITDPTSLSSSSILWEFSDIDDADLGYITSPPAVVRLLDGSFAVTFGSGYDNSSVANDTTASSSTGAGYLYVLKINRGSSWVKGTNWNKIALSGGSSTSVGSPAGIANPVASAGNNGSAAYFYLGDLEGQLWRVAAPAGASAYGMSGVTAKRVFTGASGQPITVAPRLVYNPEGGVIALFGTGKFFATTDRTSSLSTANSFYGIWDRDDGTVVTRSKLAARTLTASTATRTISGTAPIYSPDLTASPVPARQYGWYFDLSTSSGNQGERVIYPAAISKGIAFFTSQLGTSSCTAGSGYFYALDAVNGLVQLPTFDATGDGTINSSDLVAAATTSPPGQVVLVANALGSNPTSAVTQTAFIGSSLLSSGVNASSTSSIKLQLPSSFSRVNFRQITEIKR